MKYLWMFLLATTMFTVNNDGFLEPTKDEGKVVFVIGYNDIIVVEFDNPTGTWQHANIRRHIPFGDDRIHIGAFSADSDKICSLRISLEENGEQFLLCVSTEGKVILDGWLPIPKYWDGNLYYRSEDDDDNTLTIVIRRD